MARRIAVWNLLLFLVLLSAPAVRAGILYDFETYSTGALSDPSPTMTGQDGWFTPTVANSVPGQVYTYAFVASAANVTPDPQGGAQFVALSAPADSYARAQHFEPFSQATVWAHSYDFPRRLFFTMRRHRFQ